MKKLAYSTVASLRGAAGTLGHNLSWQQMRDIARENLKIVKRHRRRRTR